MMGVNAQTCQTITRFLMCTKVVKQPGNGIPGGTWNMPLDASIADNVEK